jgi:predicted ArsR family transcriptional regulator
MPGTGDTGDRKTRRAVVNLLKTEGALTSQHLAQKLGLTAMAVRQHLYALEAEKFVSVEERPVPVGRPAKHWQLTPAADRFFPEAYAELSVSLISALGDALGPEGLQRVLETRCARQQDAYCAAVPMKAPVREKLQQLARVRTAEGYMAEVKPAGKGSFLFIENHCPICVAASQCQGLCSSELDVFRNVLGPEVDIQREEHIVSGARRCAYRVTPAAQSPDRP